MNVPPLLKDERDRPCASCGKSLVMDQIEKWEEADPAYRGLVDIVPHQAVEAALSAMEKDQIAECRKCRSQAAVQAAQEEATGVKPDWQKAKDWRHIQEVDYEIEDEWLQDLNTAVLFEVLYTCAGHPDPRKAMKGLGCGGKHPAFDFRVFRSDDSIMQYIVNHLNQVPNTKASASDGLSSFVRVACTINHTGKNQAQLGEWWHSILQVYKYLDGYWRRTIEMRDNPDTLKGEIR